MRTSRIGIALGCITGLLFAVFFLGYFYWYSPRHQDFMALCATQFVHLPAVTWHSIYERDKSLPTPFPQTVEEMIEHGFTDQQTINHYKKYAEIRYFPPEDPQNKESALIEATTPRGTWVCIVGFDRQWIPKNTK
jgi:hypothetical protein